MDHPLGRRARGLAAASTLGVISLVVPAVLSGSRVRRLADGELRHQGGPVGDRRPVQRPRGLCGPVRFVLQGIVADVGTHSGTEKFAYGGAHIQVRVTSSDAYVSGNASGLSTILGLTSSEAQKVGSRWVYWKSGTSQYSALKADVTMPSVTGLLPQAKGTKLSTVTVNGRSLYVLKWTEAATSSTPQVANTLQLSASGQTLPIEATSTASGGYRATTTLSDWGETIVVPAPPSASTVSATKITG